MGARDGRQLAEERLLEYRAQAPPAEAEVAVLARERDGAEFRSHRTTCIHMDRNGIGSSTTARVIAHRPSLSSHASRLRHA